MTVQFGGEGLHQRSWDGGQVESAARPSALGADHVVLELAPLAHFRLEVFFCLRVFSDIDFGGEGGGVGILYIGARGGPTHALRYKASSSFVVFGFCRFFFFFFFFFLFSRYLYSMPRPT